MGPIPQSQIFDLCFNLNTLCLCKVPNIIVFKHRQCVSIFKVGQSKTRDQWRRRGGRAAPTRREGEWPLGIRKINCVCVFVFVFVYLYLCICICICVFVYLCICVFVIVYLQYLQTHIMLPIQSVARAAA